MSYFNTYILDFTALFSEPTCIGTDVKTCVWVNANNESNQRGANTKQIWMSERKKFLYDNVYLS